MGAKAKHTNMKKIKPLLIVANFKSYLTFPEAKNWLETFSKSNYQYKDKKVILCPSFTLLALFKDFIDKRKLPIELGAQNISRLPEGPHTGEVNGAQIKDFANYVMVGHSERRGSFGEDESVIEEKIKMSIDYNLTPLLFVQNENTLIPNGVDTIVYEPPGSISTVSGGIPDDPKDVSETVDKLRGKYSFKYVLYGGSVNSENVSMFTKLSNIDGVVPGRASLDPVEFFKIVENA